MVQKEWEWYQKMLEGARSFYLDLGGILVEVDRQTAEEHLRQRLREDTTSEEGSTK